MAGSIKIPIARTPQTSAQAPQLSYQRAAQPLDYSSISGALRQASEELTRQKKQQTSFALRNRVLEETNFLQSDFDARTQAEPLGATNFTPRYLSEIEARHKKLVEEQFAAGVDEEDLDDFSYRLGSLRTSYGARALNFQETSQLGLAEKEGTRLATNASQYAAAQPLENYSSAIREVTDFWEKYPGITAPIREAKLAEAVGAIRGGTRKSVALMFPELVVEKLDPQNLTAPAVTTRSVSGTPGTFNLAELKNAIRGPESDGDDGAVNQMGSSASGRYQFVQGTFKNLYTKVYGSGADAAWKNKRFDVDVQENLMDRLVIDNTNALETSGVPVTNGNLYVLHVLGNGDGLRVLNADQNSPVAGLLSDEIVEKNPTYFGGNKTVGEALGVIRGKVNDGGGVTVTETTTPAERKPYDPTTIQTNIPLFDDMTGEERIQVVGWARERMAQRDVSAKAEFDIKHNNLVAAATAGQETPPVLPLEDYTRVYGPLEGPRKYAQATSAVGAASFMAKAKTQSADTIAANLEALRPTDVNALDYQQKLSAYSLAQQGAKALKEAREKDPAAYVLSAFPSVAEKLQSARTSPERTAAYAEMSRAFKQLGLPADQRKPLSDAGLLAVKEQYESAPPAQRLALLNQWSVEMGDLWRPFIRQIAETGAASAFVLHHTLKDAPGRDVLMTNVIAGQDIIRQDTSKQPTAEMANAAYRTGMKEVLTHLNPSYSAAINEAAAALYIKNGGRTVTGTQLIGQDKVLYLDSLRQVLGGQSGNPDTGIVKADGGWTILPPGVNKKQFEDWKDALTFRQLQAANPTQAIPLNSRLQPIRTQDIIDYGQFVLAAPGQYWIKLSTDGGFVQSGPGKNYVVNLDPKTIKER